MTDGKRNVSSKPSSNSYASRTKIAPVKSFTHPTAEQAIIFDHIDGLQIRDYMLAIYKLVDGAENIIAASRVSGGRVIIYFSSSDVVNNFQDKYGGFYHNDNFISTRKLKTPARKLVFSNVSPEIPNTEIEKLVLNQLKLKLASPITLLRTCPNDDLFSHVICWRRQCYIHASSDLSTLPSFVLLDYADRTYRIYINADELTCFKCSNKGHKAENCHIIIDDIADDAIDQNQDLIANTTQYQTDFPQLSGTQQPQPTLPSPPPQHTHVPIQTTQETQRPQPTLSFPPPQHTYVPAQTTLIKRGPSTLTSNTSEDNTKAGNSEEHSQNKPLRKKAKKDRKPPTTFLSAAETDKVEEKITAMKSAHQIEENFNTNEFIQVLASTRQSKEKTAIVKGFCSNMEKIRWILDEIKPLLSADSKKTITALTKAIENETDITDTSENEKSENATFSS